MTNPDSAVGEVVDVCRSSTPCGITGSLDFRKTLNSGNLKVLNALRHQRFGRAINPSHTRQPLTAGCAQRFTAPQRLITVTRILSLPIPWSQDYQAAGSTLLLQGEG